MWVKEMKWLCKFFPHKIEWIGEEVKCKRCGKYASEIVKDQERGTFKEN